VEAHRDPAFAAPSAGDALPPIRGHGVGDHNHPQQQQRRPPGAGAQEESVYNYQAQPDARDAPRGLGHAPVLQPLHPHQPPAAPYSQQQQQQGYHSNSAPYGALPPLGTAYGGSGSAAGAAAIAGGGRDSGGSMLHFRSQRILDFEEFFLRKSRDLATRKAQAVGAEDFDAAKVCKEALLRLQDLSERI
ncbi:MAG: hypothetical protein Q8J97_08960, partial [Flavobacteriaceae bacterium]|nr:hypothetical protein [Flavobacteriaceae bacterium]